MEKLIDTGMSYLQYEHPWFNALHKTAISASRPPRTKHVPALEHKGKKAKNKIIPQAFYQASAFMAKSKGHVSPPASERGNYPFPVREQQMIANYGGAFCRSWILSVGRRRRFNFLAAACLLLSFFPQWSFVACFFSIHTSLLRGSASFFSELLRVYLCALH